MEREHAVGAGERAATPRSGRGARLLTAVAVATPVVVLLVLAGMTALDAATLRTASAQLEERAAAAQRHVEARDVAGLREDVGGLAEAASDLVDATDGPHWWLASHLIWVRDQVRPVIAMGQSIDAIASEALQPLSELEDLEALAAPRLDGGRIDPLLLEPYRSALEQSWTTLARESEALREVDLANTVEAVAEPFATAASRVAELEATVSDAHVAAELLPEMLGAEGPRTYLVVVQNNAEPRATGGIPGALIALTVDDGRLSLGEYRSAGDVTNRALVDALVATEPRSPQDLPEAAPPLTDDELRVFTWRMSAFPQDANFSPEFPRAAEILVHHWRAATGIDVDGVVSVDPVALGWILGDAPPTVVDGFEISGANLAQTMLNTAYLEIPDPYLQDLFFARASAELFESVVSGDGVAVDGVERAVEAGRFTLWSARPEEQELLARTAAAGAFLERPDALGVFLNDGGATKMGYYIDSAVTVTDQMCPDATLTGQTVALTLTHTYEGDVSDLPPYLAEGGGYVPAGEFHANLVVYPAAGTRLEGITADGERLSLHNDVSGGRPVGTVRVAIAPGESLRLNLRLASTEAGVAPPEYVQTPGPRPLVLERAQDDAAEGCA